MKKPLKSWGPWENNPSSPENFYDTNESFVEEGSEDLNEEEVQESAQDSEKDDPETQKMEESEDPYTSILKDLK